MEGLINGSRVSLYYRNLSATPQDDACPPWCGQGYDIEPWSGCYEPDCGWTEGGGGQGSAYIIDVGGSGSCNFAFSSETFSSCYIASILPDYDANLLVRHQTSGKSFYNVCRNPGWQQVTAWFTWFYQADVFAIGFTNLGANPQFNFYAPSAYEPGLPARLDISAFIESFPFPFKYFGYCDYSGL